MKLPLQRKRGVASLGTYDVSGPGRVVRAENAVLKSAANAVYQGVDIYRKMKEVEMKELVNERVLQYDGQIASDQNRLNNQKAYDTDVPEDLEFLGDSTKNLNLTDGNGGTRTVVRDHEVMESLWATKRDQAAKNAKQGLNAEQQAYFDKQVARRTMEMNVGMERSSILAKNKHLKQTVIDQVDELKTQGRYDEAIAVIADAEQFTEAESSKEMLSIAKEQEAKIAMKAAIEGGELAAVVKANFLDPEYNGPSSPAQRMAYVADIDGAEKKRNAAALKEKKRVHNAALGRAMVEAKRGTLSQSRAYWFLEQDIATPSQYAKMVSDIDKANKKAVAEDNDDTWVMSAYDSPRPIPNEKEAKDKVDDFYDRNRRGTENELELGAQDSMDGGYIPKGFKAKMDQLAFSQDAKDVQRAADIWGAMAEQNQHVIKQFDKSTSARLESVYLLGKTTTGAAEIVMERTAGLTPEQTKHRNDQYKKHLKDAKIDTDKLAKKFAAEIDPRWQIPGTESTQASIDMRFDYENAYQTAWLQTGNAEVAQQAAESAIRNDYNKYTINAPANEKWGFKKHEVDKYAPQNYYDIDIEENRRLFIEKYGLVDEDVLIRPDPKTARDPDDAKTYAVVYIDPVTNRPRSVLSSNGGALRWPDPEIIELQERTKVVEAQAANKVVNDARQSQLESLAVGNEVFRETEKMMTWEERQQRNLRAIEAFEDVPAEYENIKQQSEMPGF